MDFNILERYYAPHKFKELLAYVDQQSEWKPENTKTDVIVY